MKLAVGKGSLQRAASAAGKNTKAKSKAVKADEAKVQDEAAKATETQGEAVKADKATAAEAKVQDENAKAEAVKVDEGKVQSEATKATAAKSQSEPAKTVKTAGTRGRSAKVSAEKTDETTASVKAENENANATAVKTRKKRTVKQQDSVYLLTVSAEQLLEIPKEWKSGKQIRENVSALAESVSRCGILEPLPVVQTGENQYQLVGGSKRMQVVQMLGIANVPVLVLPGSTQEEAQKLYQELNLEAGTAKKQNQTLSLFGKQRIPEYLL